MNQILPRTSFTAEIVARAPLECSPSGDVLPHAFLTELLARLRPVAAGTSVALDAAFGRVLATDVASDAALPPFDQSAMDGFGLHAADLDAGRRLVVAEGGDAVASGAARRLFTGSRIPDGVAAVLRREDACRLGDSILATRPVADGADIRRRGEDVRPGDRLGSAGAVVDARLVALLAAAGVTSVAVTRKVRVMVLSTGDELLGGPSGPAVLDANGPMLRALLADPSAEIVDGGTHPDDPARLATVLRAAAVRADLIVTTGGSAGSEVDVLVDAVHRAGGAAQSHRLALKPGKPVITGAIGAATLLGLPGNPFAAFVSAQLFARPTIAAMAGRPFAAGRGSAALLAGPSRPAEKRREFLPASIIGFAADGRPLVEPGRPGAARLAPLAAADGIVELAPHDRAIEAGHPVAFHPAGNVSR